MKQNYLYEILELSESQKNELTAAFEKVLSVSGWINIEPFVEDDKRGETAGLFSWFSARGPQVPIGTLVFEGSPESFVKSKVFSPTKDHLKEYI